MTPASGATLPDLVVSGTSGLPAFGASGASFTAVTKVRNVGGSRARASRLGLYLSRTPERTSTAVRLVRVDVPALAAGVTRRVSVRTRFPRPLPRGSYYLIACADDARTVRERHEGNNCRATARASKVGADLVVTGVAGLPTTASPGATFTASARVANTGSVKAGASTLRWYLSPEPRKVSLATPLGEVRLSELPKGGAVDRTASLKVPGDTPAGPHYLLACADDTRQVAEAIEGNNCRAGSTTTVEPAPTSDELIDAAVRAGTIDAETGWAYRLFALHKDPRLPAAYTGRHVDDHALPREVAAHWTTFSAATRAELAPFYTPPAYEGGYDPEPTVSAAVTERTLSSQTTTATQSCFGPQEGTVTEERLRDGWALKSTAHANIWYLTPQAPATRHGLGGTFTEDAVASEAAATLIAAAFEEVWQKETGLFGRFPPSDVSEPCNGTDGAYDVYVGRLSPALDAQVVPYPAGWELRPSWMWIAPDAVATADDAKALVAHEFTHAIQAGGYDYAGPDLGTYQWLEEAVANWAIDFVHPAVDFEHRWADLAFQHRVWGHAIDLAKQGDEQNGYSDYLFFLYLARTKGPSAVAAVMSAVQEGESTEALYHGVPGGLNSVWHDYLISLLNTPPRADLKNWDGVVHGIDTADQQHATQIDVALGASSSTTTPIPSLGVDPRAGRLTRFTFPEAARSLKFEHYGFEQNPYQPPASPDDRIQARLKLADGTVEVQDWTDGAPRQLCRDRSDQDVTEVVLVHTYVSPVPGLRVTVQPQWNHIGMNPDFAQRLTRSDGTVTARRSCGFPQTWTGSGSGEIVYRDENGVVTGTEAFTATYSLAKTTTAEDDTAGFAAYDVVGGNVTLSRQFTIGSCTKTGTGSFAMLGGGMFIGEDFPDDSYAQDLSWIGPWSTTTTCPSGSTTNSRYDSWLITTNDQPWQNGTRILTGSDSYKPAWAQPDEDITVSWSWTLTAAD